MGHIQHNHLKLANLEQFSNELRSIADDVEGVLASFLNDSTQLGRAMSYAVLAGGKRFRAFLTVAIGDCFQVNRSYSLRAAAAIELVHAYSLIHDDLPAMDNAPLRRGKPSCHVEFNEATAILAGDTLIPMAFELLSERKTHPDGDVRLQLIKALAGAIGPQGMPLGQMQDLGLERPVESIDQLLFLEHLKTGELMACACEFGAILGGASELERQALRVYGQNIGIAFQIVDDLLDAISTTEDLGKPTGLDSEHKKATFLSLLGKEEAWEKANDYVLQAIDTLTVLGKPVASLEEAAHFTLIRMK